MDVIIEKKGKKDVCVHNTFFFPFLSLSFNYTDIVYISVFLLSAHIRNFDWEIGHWIKKLPADFDRRV